MSNTGTQIYFVSRDQYEQLYSLNLQANAKLLEKAKAADPAFIMMVEQLIKQEQEAPGKLPQGMFSNLKAIIEARNSA